MFALSAHNYTRNGIAWIKREDVTDFEEVGCQRFICSYNGGVQIINQYSYIFVAIFLLGLVGIFLFRKGIHQGNVAIFVGTIIGFVFIWLIVRPQKGVEIEPSEIQGYIGAGIPVLLEFQSPY